LRALQPGEAVLISHGEAWWGAVTPEEVSQAAPSLVPGSGLRKAIESRRRNIVTAGDRIPIRELEAGLTAADEEASRVGAQVGEAFGAEPEFGRPVTGRRGGPVFPTEGAGYDWPEP